MPAASILTADLPEFVVMQDIQSTDLSSQEVRVAQWLSAQLFDRRQTLLVSDLYYQGMQAVTNLGISTPPELQNLRSIMGWGESGVNAIDERLAVQGFRLPNTPVSDDELWQIWQSNNLDAEHTLVHLDAMIYGTAYTVIGVDDEGEPLVTVESPLDMTSVSDTRSRKTTCAYQTYVETDPMSEFYSQQRAALYTPESTVHLVNTSKGWRLTERDDHALGRVPVVPFLNRSRIGNRRGSSEITAAWRNTIDRACRAQTAMEINTEFFIAPKMLLLGATEASFQKADGTVKTAWETYMGRVLALEADEHGNLPQVQRFASESPEPMLKRIDHETRVMAGLTGLPPQYLGIFSDGNPSSADAIRMSDFRLKMQADRKCVAFGNGWEETMRLALLVRGQELPDGVDQMETDWAPTGIPTPAADTDAVTKQIAAGMLPPTSDVALSTVGYSAVQRSRIANEQTKAEGTAKLDGILANARAAAQPPVDPAAPVNAEQPPINDQPNPIPGG